MESFTGHEISALLDFLHSLYALRELPAFHSYLISALAELVPSDITTYNEVNCATRQNATLCEPTGALEFTDSHHIFNQLIPEHPLIGHYAATGDTRVLKISDFWTQGRFHSSGLYSDFYQRVGVEHQAALTLPAAQPVVIGIALNRTSQDFTERERLLLSLIRPHLVQAYDNAAAVTAMVKEAASGKNTIACALAVLSSDGCPRFITAEADELFTKYFGSLRAGRLPGLVTNWIDRRRSALTCMRPVEPLIASRGEERLILRLLTDGDQLLLHMTEEGRRLSRQQLQELGLTLREAEVLAFVALGKTNPEIAVILGVSPRTVKKHLERIFQKLGVESRTAAAVRVWDAAA